MKPPLSNRPVPRALFLVLNVGAAALLVAGCSGGQADLQKWIADTKKHPGGRIAPLPEVKPYETFAYSAASLRSPFQPQGQTGNGAAMQRRNEQRNREFLENFPLDSLKMVGTMQVGGRLYGLVKSKDGLVHKVLPGNYLGQNDGKINQISSSKISLTEIIPDGLGGYIERPASLALAN